MQYSDDLDNLMMILEEMENLGIVIATTVGFEVVGIIRNE